ncbi:hypothetical protein NMSP_0891 [Candidatus Nitrosomarinus catalina]|uniref:Uncharacterized protein n=2 Tax=Candidatus Nitrosomarinus catalinensis TaxID=1898749 RepID=A0A2Z2HTU9_9ARCH|nr:hypothetical protein NMSP_0891 [Candidatus Nitrosomarinus catalina]
MYYGIVRYVYSIVDRSIGMMQSRTIMQETKIENNIQSSVSKVECYVCGKGLSEGHSISAKTLSNGIVLFCDVHYSMQ